MGETAEAPAATSKRDELAALASGGTAGLDAYKTGTERVVSDQQAALDAALDAANARSAPTDAMRAIDSIIRPTGDAAAGRLGAANDRYQASRASLDGNLSKFKGAAAGVESLAYSTALADAQERAAKAAAERDKQLADLAQWEQKAYGQTAGNQLAADAYAANQVELEMSEKEITDYYDAALKALGFNNNYRGRGPSATEGKSLEEVREMIRADAEMKGIDLNTISKTLKEVERQFAGTTEERVAAAVQGAAGAVVGRPPSYGALDNEFRRNAVAEFFEGFDTPNTQAYRDIILNQPDARVEPRRFMDLIEQGDAALMSQFAREGYLQLPGANPAYADYLFPSEADDLAALDAYMATGMYPDEAKAQEALIEDELESFKQSIAADAGVSAGAVRDAADAFYAGDEDAAFEALADPDTTALMQGTLAQAIADLQAGVAAGDVAKAVRDNIMSNAPEGVSVELLLTIALDQIENYAAIYEEGVDW